MTRSYLVVFEKGASNWSGYSPNVLGCISAGDTLEHMRAMMTEALEGHLQWMFDDGDPLPEAEDNTVDFSEETPANGVEHCHVEWLTIRIPTEKSALIDAADQHEPETEDDALYADAELYPGAIRSVFTATGIQHTYSPNEKTNA